MTRFFLLLPHIKIHNANAMSSPHTIGFPAMTAWLGAVHSLQRHLHQKGFSDLEFTSVAVSCHKFNLQTYKGEGDFVYSIIGTANPLDKTGSRPAFIEEARCHLEVSLLIEYKNVDSDRYEEFQACIHHQLYRMKFAGGDVLPSKSKQRTEIIAVDEDDDGEVKKLLKKLMVGYVLIDRRDLIIESQKAGKDALTALIDHLKVMHRASEDENGNVSWESKRQTTGWIVPIATGFQGISDVGFAKNQRDTQTPHRFAESVVTLGEFIMPYRVNQLDDMLWQYRVVADKNLYLCQPLSTLSILGDS